MIYVISNGADYSDHHIYFVDASGYTEEQVQSVLKYMGQGGRNSYRPTILGCAEKYQWRVDAPMPLMELVEKSLPWSLASLRYLIGVLPDDELRRRVDPEKLIDDVDFIYKTGEEYDHAPELPELQELARHLGIPLPDAPDQKETP